MISNNRSSRLDGERPVGASGVRTANWRQPDGTSSPHASPRSSQPTSSQPSSQARPAEGRGRGYSDAPVSSRSTGLHEVWWKDGDKITMRARFRLLQDALRFIRGNGMEQAAWIKLRDGRWEHALAFEAAERE